ncbi:LysR family transcriptional regulator [Alterileibacterium massiliense]|uniref:LysR family transcriptional regulator n=1 Tax=Alterileibacterium massiliense TaxID=1870997 RepID=UPI0008DAD018|nr:LysR family transcriptional regulator [Alterileibacterium massiliense]
MELRQIYYALEIAKEKNFSKAANNLFITQSNISQQINSLEQELDTKLFVRDQHGVKLTEDGKKFCINAQKIVDEIDNLMISFNKNTNIDKEIIKIAVFPFANKVGITSVITDFFNINANLLMSIKVADNYDAYYGLESGELDFAIVKIRPEEKSSKYEYVFLSEEKLCLLVNKDNRLANKKTIKAEELSELPLLMADSSSSIYNDVRKVYKELGANFNVIFETTNDIELLNEMIANNYGVTIATESSAISTQNSKIKAIVIESPIKFSNYIVYPKDKQYNGIYKKFIEYVVSGVKNL